MYNQISFSAQAQSDTDEAITPLRKWLFLKKKELKIHVVLVFKCSMYIFMHFPTTRCLVDVYWRLLSSSVNENVHVKFLYLFKVG